MLEIQCWTLSPVCVVNSRQQRYFVKVSMVKVREGLWFQLNINKLNTFGFASSHC